MDSATDLILPYYSKATDQILIKKLIGRINALSPASSFINKVLFTIATIHYGKTWQCTCTSFYTNILISCKIKIWNTFEELRQANKSILDFSLDLRMKNQYQVSKWETDLDNLKQNKISCFIGMEWGRFDYICMLTQLYPCKCNVIHFYTASIIHTFFTHHIWRHWLSSQINLRLIKVRFTHHWVSQAGLGVVPDGDPIPTNLVHELLILHTQKGHAVTGLFVRVATAPQLLTFFQVL